MLEDSCQVRKRISRLGYIFGLEYFLHPSIRIGPNVEVFDYDDSAISKDVVTRLTFYWTW